jgi:hypothetical protein
MSFFTNSQTLGNEYQNPGLQATQPLVRPPLGEDALSSTTSLNNPYALGGINDTLSQLIEGADNQGYTGSSLGGYNSTSSPFNPSAPIQQSSTNSGSTDGGWINSAMGGSSVSGNSLASLSNSLGNMGGVFNRDFLTHNTTPEGGINNTGWMDSNSLFNDDSLLGSYFSDDVNKGIDAVGFGNKVANAFGYGNKDLSGALSIAGASPRSLVNAYAGYTDNAALGMLTGDFSQRGITNTALQQSGLPYGGSVMGLADYGMGYNNYGAAASTAGGLFGPVGSALGGLFGHNLQGYYGADKDATTVDKYNESYLSKYNDNYGTYEGDVAANQYARDYGLKPGTHEFDRVVDAFKVAYTKSKDFRDSYEDNYPSAVEDSKSGQIYEVNNVDDAIKYGVPYGKEGDDTWTDGTTTWHSGGYNWNNKTNSGSDSFGNTIGTQPGDVAGTSYDGYDHGSTSTGDAEGGFSKEESAFANSFNDNDDSGGSTDSGGYDGGYGDDSDDGGAGWGSNDADDW